MVLSWAADPTLKAAPISVPSRGRCSALLWTFGQCWCEGCNSLPARWPLPLILSITLQHPVSLPLTHFPLSDEKMFPFQVHTPNQTHAHTNTHTHIHTRTHTPLATLCMTDAGLCRWSETVMFQPLLSRTLFMEKEHLKKSLQKKFFSCLQNIWKERWMPCFLKQKTLHVNVCFSFV